MRSGQALPWYQTAFGEHYLAVYPHRDDEAAAAEVRFVLETLALPAGARVLDLCCGGGRHLSRLAESGLAAIGLDLSAPLLQRAGARGLRVTRADMRRLPLAPAAFDAVVNLFTSFGYFTDEAENAAALREIARVLRPGGKFLIDHIHAAALAGSLVPESRRQVGGRTISERRSLDPDRKRIEKSIRIEHDAGPAIQYTESVRYYGVDELEGLLGQAGLAPIARFGSLRGGPFGPDAERMVLVARKR